MNILPVIRLSGLLFLSGYCRAQGAGGYQVVGHVRGLADGTKVYLIDGGQRKTIDSATVRQARFALTGKLAEATHTYLHAGKGRTATKLADILLDNREVSVLGTEPVYDSVTVRGSDIDQQWKEWYAEDGRLSHYRYAIGQVQKALLGRQDTANASSLKKLAGEIQLARVTLLKTYVRRYHSTAAGAALPTMCTLGPLLTKADYLEMYNALTPKWQQSAFGKEIITQANKKRSLKALN